MNDTTTAAPAADATEHVITLDPPLSIGGIDYRELRLREPTVAQWTLYENLSGVAADIVAVSTISGVPQTLVESMPMSEFARASRWLREFMSDSRAVPPPAVEPGAKTLAMPLRRPVTWDGRSYAEFTLREPTAKEWREFDALGGAAADVRAVALAAGVPEAVVHLIGVRDLFAASRWIASFFPNAPASGGE